MMTPNPRIRLRGGTKRIKQLTYKERVKIEPLYNKLHLNKNNDPSHNFYYFTYVENRGAAFGIMQNKQWFFVVVTLLIFVGFGYVLKKYKIEGKLFFAAVVLIFGGGVGNLIDRIFRGYVVDFLQFSFFSPVCNLADYFITVGAVMLIISVLFCKKNIARREPVQEKAE